MALFNQNRDAFQKHRAVTYVLTFILPLLGALFAADQFLSVLSYAGFILVFLAVFIPMAMTQKLRNAEKQQCKDNQQLVEGYQVGGGTIGMLLSLTFGFFLIGAQLV